MGLATTDPHSLKEHTEIHKIPFTNLQRNVWPAGQLSGSIQQTIHFFVNCDIFNGLIVLTIGSIYTKLGGFVNLGVNLGVDR